MCREEAEVLELWMWQQVEQGTVGPPPLASVCLDDLPLLSGAGFCQLLKQWAPSSGRLGSFSAKSLPKRAEGPEWQLLKAWFSRAARQMESEVHCTRTCYAEPEQTPSSLLVPSRADLPILGRLVSTSSRRDAAWEKARWMGKIRVSNFSLLALWPWNT